MRPLDRLVALVHAPRTARLAATAASRKLRDAVSGLLAAAIPSPSRTAPMKGGCSRQNPPPGKGIAGEPAGEGRDIEVLAPVEVRVLESVAATGSARRGSAPRQ